MGLTYDSRSGAIELDGHYEGIGYSGRADGRNNPDLEYKRGIGPIPVGEYRISPPFDDPRKGPLCFRLTPIRHDAHGRSGFMIHGDNKDHDASEGCIIAGRTIRQRIANDHEKLLEVFAGEPDRSHLKPLMESTTIRAAGTVGGGLLVEAMERLYTALTDLSYTVQNNAWLGVGICVAGLALVGVIIYERSKLHKAGIR